MTDRALDEWAATLARELGVDITVDVDAVLDLAALAAHRVKRPAAPLTTFLAGFAAGRAGGREADLIAAIGTSAALCQRQVGSDGEDAGR